MDKDLRTLELYISSITRLARRADCLLSIKRVEQDGYIVSNEKETRIAAVGMLHIKNEEDEEEKVLGAFTIDVQKYKWAEAEGFTQDEMIDKLTEEIFNLIGVDEVFGFLCDKK